MPVLLYADKHGRTFIVYLTINAIKKTRLSRKNGMNVRMNVRPKRRESLWKRLQI